MVMNRQKPPIAADQTVFTERGPLCLPMDLRQWANEETLVQWITEEIEAMAKNPRLALEAGSRARAMLGVLVFAYATQTFLSEDICRACRADKTYMKLCNDQGLFKQELEQFRRKNRETLEVTLTGVLTRAVKERYSKLGKLPPGMEYGLRCRAVDRLDTARHMDTWDE
jgi:hypothetical protein